MIKIPKNKEELIFKLKTSDKPFALIKIGDISPWLKDKLENYEINESYDNKSYFKIISQDNNSINILMGSRSFYEGWDSNRPNVMIFINIGKGDAKKYVTQSIGRGVRIEPIKGKRKRLLPLKRENDIIAKEVYSKLDQEDISLIETLFVLGTNKKNVQEILDSIKYERKASGEIIELQENEEVKDKILLIPVYKNRKEVVAVEKLPGFEGNKKLLTDFIEWIGDERILYTLFSHENYVNPKTIEKTKDFLKNGNFLAFEGNDVYSQLNRLMSHVNITLQDLDRFKQVEDEIIHFKRINVRLEVKEFNDLKMKIEKVTSFKNPEFEKIKLKQLLKENKITLDEYTLKIEDLSRSSKEEMFKDLIIKNVARHYYIPLIVSLKEKIDYINHIINVESEKRFIEELEKYLSKKGNEFEKFDWWMFSKLDEHLDNVYIPYYNKAHNRIEKFKPDFIFWLKKGNKYFIIFVDPKGTKHTDYEYKVDGYKLIFEEKNRKKSFSFNKLNVQVYLFLFTEDVNELSEGYKKYWFDNFDVLLKKFLKY